MTCTKIPYDTKKEAKKQIRYMNKNGKKGQRPYRCIGCNKFHLTSQTKKKSKSHVKKTMIHLDKK